MKRALLMVLLAAGLPAATSAQEVGRLFTSPAERAALERQRIGGVTTGAAASADPAPPVRALVEGEQLIEVNGIVRRSGAGRATTWIDSAPRGADGKLAGGVRLGPDSHKGRVTLTLASGKTVLVKPGQRVDALSGKILEGYQSGRVFIPSRKKED